MNKDIAFYECYDYDAWKLKSQGGSQLKQECVNSKKANHKISTAQKNPDGWERIGRECFVATD